MCFYIGIEDLAANALIESMRRAEKTFLTYKEIENYGSKVVKFLNEKGEKAVLILSRESTNALFRNYSDFFKEKKLDGEIGIELKEDVTLEKLIVQFRGYLALDVLMAFVNENSVQALGV
ncbi:MAG: hypothetical protein IJA34_08530 [Lachnospiraceae bacterium]|nr:hypothetical protein [Lachnospiraceae bacterium]